MAKVTDLVQALVQPFCDQQGVSLWDVEYVKEAGQWFLRVFIDKQGGLHIEDCEAVSRPLSDLLDERDPIEGSYVLEVGSAGVDRALKKPEHFAAYVGTAVDVKLYRPRDGSKEWTGALVGYQSGDVTLQINDVEVLFPKSDVALVRLHLEF
jgi:Uncharacterized protein conserved in bacteria